MSPSSTYQVEVFRYESYNWLEKEVKEKAIFHMDSSLHMISALEKISSYLDDNPACKSPLMRDGVRYVWGKECDINYPEQYTLDHLSCGGSSLPYCLFSYIVDAGIRINITRIVNDGQDNNTCEQT